MNIIIPENIGSELRVLEGTAHVVLEKIIMGKSKANQPKVTFRYIIDEEMDGYGEDTGVQSAVGEHVLETFSLQPQAIFKLNEVYMQVTGERLPMGEYTEDQFAQMLNEALTGTEFYLSLEAQLPADGSSDKERTVVVKREVA